MRSSKELPGGERHLVEWLVEQGFYALWKEEDGVKTAGYESQRAGAEQLEDEAVWQRRMLFTFGQVLEHVCLVNTAHTPPSPRTTFDASAMPAISVLNYLVRIKRYAKFDFSCFLIAATYMSRLCQADVALCPTLRNVHRILLISLSIAAKIHSDRQQSKFNLFMSRCGGIELSELNVLELDICRRLNWELQPSLEDFSRLRYALEAITPSYWDHWCVPSCPSSAVDPSMQTVAIARSPSSVADDAIHSSLLRFPEIAAAKQAKEATLETSEFRKQESKCSPLRMRDAPAATKGLANEHVGKHSRTKERTMMPCPPQVSQVVGT
mmetsp:Transcript_24800/g.52702  ORF Transcript_24800/g.52702 Transcript_24800/m.52702 type:complete len:324 (-) Transcript_24800:87-1058(-)